VNSLHSNFKQLTLDDAASLQMADEGCPNESTLLNDLDGSPAVNLANKPDKLDSYFLFDLPRQIQALKARSQSVASNTLLKTDDLRIVLLFLNKAAKMNEHHADARTSLQILSGAVHFQVGEVVQPLRAGSLITLEPSIAHAIEALEPSVLLMTMAWPTTSTLRSIPHRGYS
jgi:quercetin dioxygenase-like cupin family protein